MGSTLGSATDPFKVHFHDVFGDQFTSSVGGIPLSGVGVAAAGRCHAGARTGARTPVRTAGSGPPGRLAAGTRLPSSRELAADLGVSRGLVTEAYEQLTAESYLRSGQGAGTWVNEGVRAAERPVRDRAPGAAGARVDFRPGTPDLSLFPRSAWSAAQRTVFGRLPHGALGYPDPRGLPELREALAGLLARRRGVVADPERLVVCSGWPRRPPCSASCSGTRA